MAECAFGTVERGLVAEGGPTRSGFPRSRRRFVAAGGLTALHDGLCEYELVDVEGRGADARGRLGPHDPAVGGVDLERPDGHASPPGRPGHADAGAQLPGARRAEVVVHLGDRDPHALADEAFTPILTGRFPGGDGRGDPEASGRALQVTGAEVSALTRRPDGRLELRLVNTTDAPAAVGLGGRTGERTDLAGEPTGERVVGSLELRPREIATLALDEGAATPPA
ncbi:MAG: hypothetical protein R2711_18190 [Acidimicrobiales bacterium]